MRFPAVTVVLASMLATACSSEKNAAIAYARSLEGVTGMVLGVHTREQLEENIRRVLEVEPLSKEDFEKLCAEGKEIARTWEPRFGPAA